MPDVLARALPWCVRLLESLSDSVEPYLKFEGPLIGLSCPGR